MATPRANLAQPGTVAQGLLAQLALDGRVHEHPLDALVGGRELDQLGDLRPPRGGQRPGLQIDDRGCRGRLAPVGRKQDYLCPAGLRGGAGHGGAGIRDDAAAGRPLGPGLGARLGHRGLGGRPGGWPRPAKKAQGSDNQGQDRDREEDDCGPGALPLAGRHCPWTVAPHRGSEQPWLALLRLGVDDPDHGALTMLTRRPITPSPAGRGVKPR